MIMTCKSCGKEFDGRDEKTKFCSVQCRGVGRRLRVQATCTNCHKVFEGRPSDIRGRLERNKHIFCGSKCALEYQKGQPKPSLQVELQERICPACGKSFFVGGRKGKKLRSQFCSKDCALAAKYHHGKQSSTLSDTDAAYLAGFIDGEGTIMLIVRANKSVGVLFTVANTKKEPIEWLMEVSGVGRLLYRERRSTKHAPTYWWQASSEAAESLLRQILPYLKIKGEQAKLALEFQERLRTPAFKADRALQAEYRERMKALNKRGGQH